MYGSASSSYWIGRSPLSKFSSPDGIESGPSQRDTTIGLLANLNLRRHLNVFRASDHDGKLLNMRSDQARSRSAGDNPTEADAAKVFSPLVGR